MKKMIMFLFLLMAIPVSIFAQGDAAPIDFNSWVATLATVAAAAVFLSAGIIQVFKITKKCVKQIVAWLVAIALTFAGNLLGVGFAADFPWLTTLAYGFGAGLVSNGLFDINAIQSVLTALNLKKVKK